MRSVFIILGVIIVVSFITGFILVRNEKKKKVSEVLTDDAKILFEENLENLNSNNVIVSNDISVQKDNEDSSFLNGTSVHENEDIVDHLFDEEII